MSVLESGDYQAARERIKGNPIVSMMAAGVVTVPLAELAHEDGTPRFPSDEPGQPRLRRRRGPQRGQPRLPAVPGRRAPAYRADRRGRPGRARSEMRAAVASAMAAPGTDPESADVTPGHRADAGRGVSRVDRPRDRSHPPTRHWQARAARPSPGRGKPRECPSLRSSLRQGPALAGTGASMLARTPAGRLLGLPGAWLRHKRCGFPCPGDSGAV